MVNEDRECRVMTKIVFNVCDKVDRKNPTLNLRERLFKYLCYINRKPKIVINRRVEEYVEYILKCIFYLPPHRVKYKDGVKKEILKMKGML